MLTKAEDGRHALTLLRAITEGCIAEWKHLDDDDARGSLFFSDLTAVLAEALLCADLNYLYLAEAEGQLELYNIMLVHLGRIQEAMDYGLNYVSTPMEALAIAQALYG